MDLSLLKTLREETGASIMECKRALERWAGDTKKTKEYLREVRYQSVQKRAGRVTRQGVIASYIHSTKRVGSLVELHCETDFVARTSEFQRLASELALHIAGMAPKNVKELLSQAYVRDPSLPVSDLISQTVHQLGENVKVRRFIRYEL